MSVSQQIRAGRPMQMRVPLKLGQFRLPRHVESWRAIFQFRVARVERARAPRESLRVLFELASRDVPGTFFHALLTMKFVLLA